MIPSYVLRILSKCPYETWMVIRELPWYGRKRPRKLGEPLKHVSYLLFLGSPRLVQVFVQFGHSFFPRVASQKNTREKQVSRWEFRAALAKQFDGLRSVMPFEDQDSGEQVTAYRVRGIDIICLAGRSFRLRILATDLQRSCQAYPGREEAVIQIRCSLELNRCFLVFVKPRITEPKRIMSEGQLRINSDDRP